MGFHLGEIENPPRCGRSSRSISTGTDTNFPGENAYAVLGVSESSTFTEIKASFRKLAKETHPDLSPSPDAAAASSRRFLQIVAAYEILSDSERRAHYDNYLFAQRRVIQKQTGLSSNKYMYKYASSLTLKNQSEVVEWIRWYRLCIDDILTHKKIVTGSGYFDVLENEFYSAVHAAYYGPLIESMDLLPDRFEAEERSGCETSEVLHLVSGRDLFGIVYLVNKVPELSKFQFETLSSFSSMKSELHQSAGENMVTTSFVTPEKVEEQKVHVGQCNEFDSDTYKDLELHISGQLVAMASRIPPKNHCSANSEVDSQDNIHVFLRLNEENGCVSKGVFLSDSASGVGSMTLLGTIRGLGTTPEEGSCAVYDPSGARTHVIMKHRTPLVKHMHWYQFGAEVSTCECRSSRAQLPPSKFWLFEPRCAIHDVGGWYIETFGRDKKGRTVPSQRLWDGKLEYHEKRLHPAMYLVALAYRTLDLEDARRRKRTIRSIIEPKLSGILHWCKKLI